ncbi:MAG: hypothetical protein PWQ55_589 [Chloroflexota bacterium]|nr:hypothetical protein [Chloroflexota bacterium]
MNLTTSQKINRMSTKFLDDLRSRPINIYTLIMIAALIAFEVFNFSTTDFALQEMLGGNGMGALRWSTILALAFCGMDFAGIASLLSGPKDNTSRASWFMLGAWVVAATMNAGLTWWGVSVTLYNQPADSVMVLDPLTFVTVIPALVSLGVWIIRILIIASLIYAFNPKLEQPARKAPQAVKATSSKRAFGFQDNPQPMPSGFQPLNTHGKSQHEPFRY